MFRNSIEKIAEIEQLPSIERRLKNINLDAEKLKQFLKRLQYHLITLKLKQQPRYTDEDVEKIKKLFLKLSLLEQQIFEDYVVILQTNRNDLKYYEILFSTLATFFEFGSEFFNNWDYSIKCAVLYCFAENESNSQFIFDNMVSRNQKVIDLLEFDYSGEDLHLESEIKPGDLIILLILLFFGRKISDIRNTLIKNTGFLNQEQVYSDWVEIFTKLLNFIDSGVEPKDIGVYLQSIDKNSSEIDIPLYHWLWKRFKIKIFDFFKNSVWNLANLLPNFPNDFIFSLIKNDIIELWKSQRDPLIKIKDLDKNNVFLMPTSAGKTLLAEIQIIYHLSSKGKKIIYICPTNSLINQVYVDFWKHFSVLGYNILKFSGTYERIYKIDEILLEQSNIIIITPEKLDLLLRKKGYEFLEQFSLFILDEFQLIEDSDRGAKYELLLSRIKEQIIERNLSLNFTILSACIPDSNIIDIVEWFNSERTSSFFTDWKPTRLIEGFYDVFSKDQIDYYLRLFSADIGWDITLPLDKFPFTIDDEILNLLRNLIENFSPIMIFYERKDLCEGIIKKIYNIRSSLKLEKIDDELLDNTINYINSIFGESNEIAEYLKYGIIFHHAGLPAKIREAIEELIRKKLIKIFACTTTFAQGINFPVHSIIFHSIFLYSESKGRREKISQKLFLNIVGRAGRALKYNEGFVLVKDPYQLFSLLKSPPELISDLSNLSDYELSVFQNDIDSFIERNHLFSNINVDLLSFEQLDDLDLNEYIKTTYFFAKLKVNNRVAEIQKFLPFFEIQKEYLKEFSYPSESKSIFQESGLNAIFCKKLYNFLIDNLVPSRILNSLNNGEKITEMKEFSEINEWIFLNCPDLEKIKSQNYNLVYYWVNREELNYISLYQISKNQKDFLNKLKIINNEICTYFPWFWTVIIRILVKSEPILTDIIKFLPYFLKFGVHNLDQLIDEIYENNKDLKIDGEAITKEKIKEILEQEETNS